MARIVLTLCIFAAFGAALAACGRKGDLDTPYQAAVEARKQAEQEGKPLPPEPQPPVADKPFILDGLID